MKNNSKFILILFSILLISILIVAFISIKTDIYLTMKDKFKNGKKNKIITSCEIDAKIAFHIDELNVDKEKDVLYVRGWAFISGRDSRDMKLQILLKSDNRFYVLSTTGQIRQDVTDYFDDGHNYNNSGFKVIISTEEMKRGEYELGLILINNEKKFIELTDEQISL